MERILELLAKLGELTADEMTELSGLIEAEVDALADETPTADTADALTALADAHDQVVAEQTRRDEEQAEIETRQAEQLARLRPVADTDAGDGGEPADGEGDGEGDGAEGDGEGEGEGETPEAIAAAAVAANRPTLADVARRRPAGRAPERRPRGDETQGRALVAAADVPGRNAGQGFADMRQLADAFERRRNALGKGGKGSDGEQVIIASARVDYPEERRLSGDPGLNAERVEAAVRAGLEPAAMVAAGGLCAPLENIYEVEVIGVTDRPVRASLPSFQAARGGVSLRPAQQFQDWDASHGEWTLATDTTPGGATKAILEVLCASFEDFEVGAVTLGLKFHNITARTDPEGTAANIQASEVAFARFAENRILQQMYGLCKTLTGGTIQSAARDMLHYIDRSVAYYRSRHRLSDNIPLRTWLPRWFKDEIRADLVLGIAGDLAQLAVADALIDTFFAVRHVNVTWHLDGRITAFTPGGGAPSVAAQSYGSASNNAGIPAFPAQVEQIIAREGDFLYLDSGELDLGLVRDSTLNSVNEYVTFFEEFSGVAFRGAEALRLVTTLAPTGNAAGLEVTVHTGS